jgi:hypothetical protein
MPERSLRLRDQWIRLRATWLLWGAIVMIAFNLTEYGWLDGIERNFAASVALLSLLSLAGIGVHVSKVENFPALCLFVAGLLVGLGLACGWGVSGATGNLIVLAAGQLGVRYKKAVKMRFQNHQGRTEK